MYILTILTCTNFNLVLVFFPPYHMFIHDNEDVAIYILPSLVGIYMYTIYFLQAQINLVLVFSHPTSCLLMMTKVQ